MVAIFSSLGLRLLHINLVKKNSPTLHFGRGICQLQMATIA
jgi:hypothetical protein